MKVVVTGSQGFIGRHLMEALSRCDGVETYGIDLASKADELDAALTTCDAVFHLAGVNRPKNVYEFQSGNVGLTHSLCLRLQHLSRKPLLVLSSSTQAELQNPYGRSKRTAEEEVSAYAISNRAPAVIFRLTNVFGKWSRPNYNSVVATFCHNIARDLPIEVSDPGKELVLVYIDDVIRAFLDVLVRPPAPGVCELREALPWHTVTLGQLVDLIRAFRNSRESLLLPDFSNAFVKTLYTTYLSFVPESEFAYDLDIKTDSRGSLAEFAKSRHFGQIFISRTKPGVTRGNHFHHTKTEKFLVVEGEGLVRLRRVEGTEIVEYCVRGSEFRVVDIPPGYTHSITNVGNSELITLFWASEIFDPESPDTYFLEVAP